jgi:hypothetical protein
MCVKKNITFKNHPLPSPSESKNLRILQVRRKNEEYAERSFQVQQCPGTLKGQCFEKMEWGATYLPRMNSLQYLFFGYCYNKNCSMRTQRIR